MSFLILFADVSASVISVRQDASNCPESCYGSSVVDPSNTAYYRSLCTSQRQLGSIVTCFRDTCPGTDASIADLKDRCAKAGVTLTVTYTSNTIQISSSSTGPPPAPASSTTITPPPVPSSSTTDASTTTDTSTSNISVSSSPRASSQPSSSPSSLPTPTPPPDSGSNSNPPQDKPPLGPIIGGTVGGGIGLILLILAFVFWPRKGGSGNSKNNEFPTPTPSPAPPPPKAFPVIMPRSPTPPDNLMGLPEQPDSGGGTIDDLRPPVYEEKI
ncbi:hypothetical protein BDZ94DRAFT_1324732 [Collybia nuda]|uniref:Extracellular membrane protein CFEM domain-containing protein n=1 Tax=Collybia nuda TaxID=64659 RepID=A0A9P5Y1H2_9AGAR|nr:hypothetical protein BDZ94DRAFT_1324732 [Collybia nuda]